MKKVLAQALVTVGLAGLLWVVVIIINGVVDAKRAVEAQQKWRERQIFERAYFAGARAATHALALDTNTGKWALELTNLMHSLDVDSAEDSLLK